MKKPKLKAKKNKKLPKYQEGGFDQTAQLQDNPMLGMNPQATGLVGMGAGIAGTATDFIPVNQTTGKGAIGKGVASGALKGASAGAAFGPAGMLIGAGLGAGVGALQGKQQKEQIQATEADRLAAIEAEKQAKQAQVYQGQMDKYTFAKGGKMYCENGGEVNAELEKQENVLYPNGETEQFNGPSHEAGGIPVNLEPGTQVFSDKLKSSTGKTFAKEAKKYSTDKFKKVLDDVKADKLAKESARLMFTSNNKKLDELFNEQESQKSEKINKGIQRLQMKYGGTAKYQMGGINRPAPALRPVYQVRNVGGVDKAYKYSTSDTTAAPFGYKNLPPSAGGSVTEVPLSEYSQFATQHPNQILYGQSGDVQNTFEKPYIPKYENTQPPVQLKKNGGVIKKFVEGGSKRFPGQEYQSENSTGIDYNNLAFQGLNFLGQNAGNLAYLREQGKDYDRVNYGDIKPEEVKPELLNVNPALQNARIQASNIQRGIRQGAVGGGSYLSNLGASQAGLINTTGNIVDQYQQTNTGIKNQAQATNIGARNQAKYFNQQNRIQAMRDEAANKGQAATNKYQAIANIGQAAGETAIGLKRDQNIKESENMKMNLLKDLYANYTWNPVTQQWLPKTK